MPPRSTDAATVTIDRKDPRFDTLKKGHNLRFPATEAEAVSRIVLCSNADEAADALQRIVASGLRPTVRCGGHCYEDFVSNNPSGAILDLSLHNAVNTARPATPPYSIAPGAVLGDVYAHLYKRFGVTLPAGTCYMVGAGGHISGGGYGLLSRLHGLTVDWISAVDILTVDHAGRVVPLHADATTHPDLLRACRGNGNGNFGLITNFYFSKLPPAPREVATATLAFSWNDMDEAKFTKLLTTYGEYWETRGKDPDTWGLFTIMGLNPKGNGQGRLGIHAQFCNPDGSVSDLAPMHEFFSRFKDLHPVVQLPPRTNAVNNSTTAGQQDVATEKAQHFYEVNRLPWLDATLAGGGSGGGTRAKYKSSYMRQNFLPAECSTIYRFLTSPDSVRYGAILAVDSYGGAANLPQRLQDTSIAQRSSIMKLQWQSYWRDQDDDQARIKFLDDFYTSLYTGDHVDAQHQGTPWGDRYEGCYMNYPDRDMLRYSFWPELFFGRDGNYAQLQKVKQQYDPNNIFHHAMSVRLPA